MTKQFDHEIKALRAMVRALQTLDPAAQERAVDWLHASVHHTTQDRVRDALRLVRSRSSA
jgi:hypothetical protein